MPLLGLLWGATGLTSVGRYLMIGAACLAVLGFVANGIVAPYRGQIAMMNAKVAALAQLNVDLVRASQAKDEQLESDRKSAEASEQRSAEMSKQVREIIDASPSNSSICKLTSGQLRNLRTVASRAGG